MTGELYAIMLISAIAEIVKAANGQPVTKEQIDAAIAARKQAVADNAALDPKD